MYCKYQIDKQMNRKRKTLITKDSFLLDRYSYKLIKSKCNEKAIKMRKYQVKIMKSKPKISGTWLEGLTIKRSLKQKALVIDRSKLRFIETKS